MQNVKDASVSGDAGVSAVQQKMTCVQRCKTHVTGIL